MVNGVRVRETRFRVSTLSRAKKRFFKATRTSVGPTQPPIQWVPAAVCVGIKRPKIESDQSLASSARLRMVHRDSFTCAALVRVTVALRPSILKT
jgi:hypothetical protein